MQDQALANLDVRGPGIGELAVKAAVVHTITYFFMGVIASTAMNYKEAFARPEVACYMRQLSDPWVMAGPLFQPLRGLIFALAFYPIREALFGRKRGWLVMWWLLVGLGILNTFGPTWGSVEGMIYTVASPLGQMRGWFEVVPQALLLSVILCQWVNRPQRWMNWVLGILFCVMMALPVLGLLVKK
jgi:hypothetical protein